MVKKRFPSEVKRDEGSGDAAVVTHSSGNHAQALALAGRLCSIPAYIVMPDSSPKVKVDAVREYGGIITFCESNEEVI